MRVWERFAASSLALGMLLIVFPAPAALALEKFPKHIDPKSWEVPEDMTWGDYKRIPGLDWLSEENQPPKKLRAALILGDFTDQAFRVEMTTVDPTGQKGLGVDNAAEYWLDYLFLNENANADNHGHTVNEYWLENSYGLLGVDAEAFGPYHLQGKMYEYGIRDFGGDADCPDGPDGCNGDFDTELVEASLVDVTTSQAQYGDFDFRFLLHAGYDESGVWLNYGMAMFPEPEAVTDQFGPADPKHRNWATTRYVDWTSFFSAQNIWSHALPGTLATEGESDGGSVYAHELSHVLGVLDNYNNPYEANPKRAYSGPWDMMSRGTFNGPGGPFERYTIPPVQGATMGSHHMLRNKLRMGFTPANEVLTVTRGALEAAGIVRTTILQRESPPAIDDPALNSGIRIVLGDDRYDCDYNESLCDGGDYDFYDVEVVNRQGFDSYIPDHGVLIAKSKTVDASPFIWVVDAFPKDIGLIDYVTADGTKVPYTIGDYRQLADATFHAGTAPGTKNVYVDEANALAFYVLDTKVVDGWRTYDVAVQSLESANAPGDPELKKVKGKLTKDVTPQVYEITNTGTGPAVYMLKVKTGGGLKTRMLNDLVYLDGGATAKVVVWAKRTGSGGSLSLSATTL